jgi:hypothetical protein
MIHAKPEIYEALESRGVKYAIRITTAPNSSRLGASTQARTIAPRTLSILPMLI